MPAATTVPGPNVETITGVALGSWLMFTFSTSPVTSPSGAARPVGRPPSMAIAVLALGRIMRKSSETTRPTFIAPVPVNGAGGVHRRYRCHRRRSGLPRRVAIQVDIRHAARCARRRIVCAGAADLIGSIQEELIRAGPAAQIHDG